MGIKELKKSFLIFILCAAISFGLSACDSIPVNGNPSYAEGESESYQESEDNNSIDNYIESHNESHNEDISEQATAAKEEQAELSVPFEMQSAEQYCKDYRCNFDKESGKLKIYVDFGDAMPKGDDENIYIFDFSTYEDEATDERTLLAEKSPLTSAKMSVKNDIFVEWEDRYLFASFAPAILYEGKYVLLADSRFIDNPDALAVNTADYPEIGSKKGLLLDGSTIGTKELEDLDVKRLVYNIPLSYIMGETQDENYPTIDFEYNGQNYKFNGYVCMIYDSLFATLTNQGFYCTAIVLNDWNDAYPDLIHPLSRQRTGQSLYYAFNTQEEDGVRMMEAAALFLARRYSAGDHGMVYDWVIANEINQQKQWNYMDTEDVDFYTRSFEKSFRTFYNAIKSNYSNANVYYSVDHDWNDNGGNNGKFFNGRDIVYAFNDIAGEHGNYDWGVAIHPYPNPLTKVKFWEGDFDKSEEAAVLTPMNFSSITDVLTKDEFLDSCGRVRNIAVTELGFSSRAGERLQAAAFMYCYYIIDNNEYINCFLINRQTDSPEEMKFGLALGLYTKNLKPKYITEVFSDIDGTLDEKYVDEMLTIIGADSIEEALKRAQ